MSPNQIFTLIQLCVHTNGVGGGFFALLVHAVVARHSAMGRLRLHRLAVRAYQHARHHAQRAKTCRNTIIDAVNFEANFILYTKYIVAVCICTH